MLLKASAPGSLMLLGEYAVLYGKPALVCAVNKRITVTLTPRQDDELHIQSSLLGSFTTRLSAISIEKPFHFVLGALRLYRPHLKQGCHLLIESDFSDKVGLGSSAAVTVATLAVLSAWLGLETSSFDLMRQGRRVIRAIQGIGSGADVAASVHGGIVSYQARPLRAEKLAMTYPLTVLYAGFKTPTVEAIRQVQQQFAASPKLFLSLCQAIGQCTVEGRRFIQQQNWIKFGEIMNVQQGIMESLGVNLPVLHHLIIELRKQPGMLGAKISGSGLGDCVIGLGNMSEAIDANEGVQSIPVEMTLQGVYCDHV